MDNKRNKCSKPRSRSSEVADMDIDRRIKRSKPSSRPNKEEEEEEDRSIEVRSSAGGKSHEIIPHLGSDLSALPEDLVQQILLKQCRRGEAVSKLVCRGFHQMMQTRPYMLARQSIVDPQEPRYCCLLLHRNITQSSQGWDPVGDKWMGFPSLGFLQNARHNVDSYNIGPMTLRRVRCADNGLLGVTVSVYTRRSVDYMVSREIVGIVCNPLTQSYVVIDPKADAQLKLKAGFTVMRAGEGGSGFTLYAAPTYGADHDVGVMYKLESSKLAAGWQRVEPLPQAVLDVVSSALPLCNYAPAPVMMGSVIYRLHICQTFHLLLVSYDMDEGLWNVDRIAEAPVSHSSAQWARENALQRCMMMRLLNVGRRLWLVQLGKAQVDPFGWEGKHSVMIFRYEPLDRTFILVQSCLLPLINYTVEEGVFGQFTICFNPLSHGIAPITYDVFTQRWFQCPAPPGSDGSECPYGGTFHLTGASAT